MPTKLIAELRKDYIQDKYVIIAPRRSLRPNAHEDVNFDHMNTDATVKQKECAFCPAQLDIRKATMIVDGKRCWQMAVLPNIFPAVSLDNPKAYGQQEVIVETPDHCVHLEELPLSQVERLFEVYAVRTKSIIANPKIEYVLIFKNNGGQAGASIQHAHSQIFATGFLPPHLLDKSQRVQAYKLKTGHCVYCDVVAKERKGPRHVYEDRLAVAFTPYASLYNYELWLMPKRHLDNVTNLTPAERSSLARMLQLAVKKIAHQLKLPYNYYFHQVVHDDDQHLYIKLTPRGSTWAGVEIGSGVVINPVLPELAAKFYRS